MDKETDGGMDCTDLWLGRGSPAFGLHIGSISAC